MACPAINAATWLTKKLNQDYTAGDTGLAAP
jgi:hypothetical protein